MQIRPVQPINFYAEAVPYKRKCAHCEAHLGSANQGTVCATCKWLGLSETAKVEEDKR